MWSVPLSFVVLALSVQVKASPNPLLENVLERLASLEDWKRETEKELTTLREIVSQQGVIIRNLERDLSVQTNITSKHKCLSADKAMKELYEKQAENNESEVVQGHVSKNGIRPSNLLKRTFSIGQRAISGGIAFTTYLDHPVDLGNKQTIKFNQEITNDGNAYNTNTGVFRCPEAGVYLFSYLIGERGDPDGSTQVWAQLVVNGQLVVGAAVQTTQFTQDLQGGNTVVVRLQFGDDVWIEAMSSGYHVEGDSGRRFTTFTGIYLYA